MTREELIRKVALKMDEISSSDDVKLSVTSGDNNPLYTQIDGLLNESVNDVLMKAPVFRLDSQVVSVNSENGSLDITERQLFGGARFAAEFSVPADFLRLVSISDARFQRPIVDFSVEGDDVDKRQHNKFLVAKYAKPVAVISGDTRGKRVACYSYDTQDEANIKLQYIRRYESEETISLDGYLIDIVSWLCAGKVFAAQGDITKGKTCDDNAAALMI